MIIIKVYQMSFGICTSRHHKCSLLIIDVRQRVSIKPTLPGSEKSIVSGEKFFFLEKKNNTLLF